MDYDIAVIGAGIAGASLAAELAPRASVVLIEAEDAPGYHATGRSAAFWSETYGGPHVQPLTTASGAELRDGGFLDPMGALYVARSNDRARADAMLAEFAGSGVGLIEIDPRAILPGLRSDWTIGIREPGCAYIDVGAYHADCLTRARQGGVALMTRAEVRGATLAGGGWAIDTAAGPVKATILVNAAGAWADRVAERVGAGVLGIQPFRRTVAQIRTDPARPDDMPIVIDMAGGFYFKPEAGGRLWLTPQDENAVDPCDVAPEEIDVAMAIDRFQQVVDWQVQAVERKWAGLRSFAPDRLPVYGFDPRLSGFFWCAGQGGFGIQTAPAAARLAASLLLGATPDPSVAHIDPTPYAPARFAL
jgi:D-arginine dehydrogenase